MPNVQDQYKPVESIDHNELLRYHLKVSGNADAEIERKKAIAALALLTNPPLHQPHQHTQIFHDAQKTSVNDNNTKAAERIEKEIAEIEDDKKPEASTATDFRHLSFTEAEASIGQMNAQIAAAQRRSAEPSGAALAPWQPISVAVAPGTSSEPSGAPISAPVATAPVSAGKASNKGKEQKPPASTAIPTWK